MSDIRIWRDGETLTPEEFEAAVDANMQQEYELYGLAGFESLYGRGRHIGLHTPGVFKEHCPGCDRERETVTPGP